MLNLLIIGGGKVAQALAARCVERGLRPLRLLSRSSPQPLRDFCLENQIELLTDWGQLGANLDLCLIAVADDAIAGVGRQLSERVAAQNLVVAHTAGGQPSDMLGAYFPNFGVFYPLQSFSEGRKVDFGQIPLCLYGNNPKSQSVLGQLGALLAAPENLHWIDDQARARLHVGAVFVNNFSNHLLAIAQQFCQAEGVDFELLKPLWAETAAKLLETNREPADLQTGAARRGDQKTISKHLQLLQKYPKWAEIYQLLSGSIADFYQKR